MSNDEYSRILLDEYKKYDYLNQHKETQLIKILVSYIKPSFLFKSNILTPIHLGRAVEKENSKDGAITDKDIKWLHENCIGDDDFEENISHVNRRVGFLTGTYWAWKNYEKLGNPDYFGSFGYRKFIAPTFINCLKNYDVIIPTKVSFKFSLKEQFINSHGQQLYYAMIDVLQKVFPEDMPLFNEYILQNSGYFHELYIMKREIFFDFCNWIFKILFMLLSSYKTNINNQGQHFFREKLVCQFLEMSEEEILDKVGPKLKGSENRDIAFILERLTGFYLYKLSKDKNIKIHIDPLIVSDECKISDNKINRLILDKMRQKTGMVLNERNHKR